jgi:hypothetical protein
MRSSGCFFLVIFLLGFGRISAEEYHYGAGVFMARNIPILGLADRYSAAEQYGVILDRKLSDRTTLEFEYHHVAFSDGKIENRTFTWGVDKKEYNSPDARSNMKVNGFLMNALVHLGKTPDPEETGVQLKPYIAVGWGIYDYKDRVSGLIYPGQKAPPLDTTILLDPTVDKHAALGVNFGVGMAVVQGKFGLDVRARYNMALGDLRPMESWGFSGVFPLSLLELRTTFKLYFR